MPYLGYPLGYPNSDIDPLTGLPRQVAADTQALPPPVSAQLADLPEPPKLSATLPPAAPMVTPGIPRIPPTATPEQDALAYQVANPPKPKLWQRLLAGAAGGAAGWVNASGRTHVDPTGAIRAIQLGGYDAGLARQGQLASLERQRQADAEAAAYRQAQMTQMGETTELRKSQQEANRIAAGNLAHNREAQIAEGLRQSKGRPLAAGEPVPLGFYKHPERVLGQEWVIPTPEHAAKMLKEATAMDAMEQLPAYLRDVEAATEALDPKQRGRVRNVLANAVTAHARAGNLKGMASVIDKWAASRNVTERITDPVRIATEIAKASATAGASAKARVEGAAEGLGGQDAIDTWSARIERGEASVTEAPRELRGKVLANVEGRILNPKQRQVIGELNRARNIMSQVFEVADKVNTSYGLAAKVKGAVQNVEAWAQANPDAQMLKSMTGGLAGNFARAIGGERGVLTDRDREYAMSLLPVIGDSRDVTKRKQKMLESFLDGASSAVLSSTGKRAEDMKTPTGVAPNLSGAKPGDFIPGFGKLIEVK